MYFFLFKIVKPSEKLEDEYNQHSHDLPSSVVGTLPTTCVMINTGEKFNINTTFKYQNRLKLSQQSKIRSLLAILF